MTWLFFNLRKRFGAYSPLSSGMYLWLWERYANRRHQSIGLKVGLVAVLLTTLLEGPVVLICGTVLKPLLSMGSYAEDCAVTYVETTGRQDPSQNERAMVE